MEARLTVALNPRRRDVQVVEGMRPFLLPIFFYAGQVNAAAESTSLSSSQLVAVAEMRALLVWILLQLRIISRDQVLLPPLPCRVKARNQHCEERSRRPGRRKMDRHPARDSDAAAASADVIGRATCQTSGLVCVCPRLTSWTLLEAETST